jgi:hypothetical protein
MTHESPTPEPRKSMSWFLGLLCACGALIGAMIALNAARMAQQAAQSHQQQSRPYSGPGGQRPFGR